MVEEIKNNPVLKKLLHEFDKAAQIHGWECDQGSEENADAALNKYTKTYNKLVKYLNGKKRELDRLKRYNKSIK